MPKLWRDKESNFLLQEEHGSEAALFLAGTGIALSAAVLCVTKRKE